MRMSGTLKVRSVHALRESRTATDMRALRVRYVAVPNFEVAAAPKGERPKYPEQQDYSEILGCECVYQSCDSLQMVCGFGERWGTRQMNDFHSELLRNGRKIAAKIEERTGVPIFCYLHGYRCISHAKSLRETCPACGKPWVHVPKSEPCFDLWYDECRLVKNRTFNPR